MSELILSTGKLCAPETALLVPTVRAWKTSIQTETYTRFITSSYYVGADVVKLTTQRVLQ